MVEGKLITISTQHSQACNLSAFLSRKIHDIAVPDTLRNRIAGACFSITLDHFDAILVLLGHKHPIYASAYSLMRVEFESYIRGIWLLNCASDEKIENFAKGELGIFPDTKSLICAVEKVSGFDGQQLTKTYIENWSDFCEYTHTGALQVQRWNTNDAIKPSYFEGEVQAVIKFTSAIAIMAAMGIVESIAKNQALAQEIHAEINKIAI